MAAIPVSEGAAAPVMDLDAVLARYAAIRPRLPGAAFPAESRRAGTLADIAGEYDGFILDAFGVLNVGDAPVPGAPARMAELRAAGKRLCVLTNAASDTRDTAVGKFRALGFDFTAAEVVSSRDVAARHLPAIAPGACWAAIAAAGDDFSDIDADLHDLLGDPALWDGAEAFLFLSSARWNAALQDRLVAALARAPRPVVIANPDLVAPRETGLTIEPGHWGHDLADRTGRLPHFFGKPYGAAFAMARAQLGPGRHAMVGDTLHTDILGARAAGVAAVLVTDHGLFAGRDISAHIRRSDITPDIIITTT